MATKKINSRSPYFVITSGIADSSGTVEEIITSGPCGDITTNSIAIDGTENATLGGTISLTVNSAGFTPSSYSWTGGNAEGKSTRIINFTENGPVSNPVRYEVTAYDSCSPANPYTAFIDIYWSSAASYKATLEITDSVVGDSQGYSLTGTSGTVLKYVSSENKYKAIVTGAQGDTYTFNFAASVKTNLGYSGSVSFSTASPITGTFGAANVTETTTLSGTVTSPVIEEASYSLSASTKYVQEGDTFSVQLITENVPANTAIPFTITGVQEADLERGSLTGSFIVREENGKFTDVKTFQVIKDTVSPEDETFTLTLNNVTGNPSVSVDITDVPTQQAIEIGISTPFDNKALACESTVDITEKAYYALTSGQVFGNGVKLFQSSILENPYPSSGQYYKIIYNNIIYNAKIGEFNEGVITLFNECILKTQEEEEEEIKNTTPDWPCSDANIQIYEGVVGKPLNFSISTNINVVKIEPLDYILGTNNYTFTLTIPDGFVNAGQSTTCSVSGTGITAAPVWTCTDTALTVYDGIEGEAISYNYNPKILSTDIISILNEDGEAVYKTGTNLTYTFKHKIPSGYENEGTEFSPACTDTATASAACVDFTCDIAQLSIPNGIVGNSVLAVAKTQKGDINSISPSAFVDGSNSYTATIQIPSGYCNYPGTINCSFTASAEKKKIPPSNTLEISSERVTEIGGNGNLVCDLTADTLVYYTGTIGNLTSLFVNPELTSPFYGTDEWHKLKILNTNNELVDYYAKIYSYPAGQVNKLNKCGYDDGESKNNTGSNTVTPVVKISASTQDDGDAVHAAFTSQKVTLTASVTGLDGSTNETTYQWYRGTASQGGTANLTLLTGETKNKLIINDGGQTQTTTGNIYYNCLVNGSYEDAQNYLIVWDTRPSFSLRYYASAEANIQACTGTSVTLYGDRAGVTSFCATEKFYSNAAGSSSPAISAGTYSDSTTGTDGNFRYIEASGIPQGCVPGDGNGCNPIVTQPTTGNIQKVKTRRCSNGRIEYFLFDGFSYQLNLILDIKDVSQQGGRGCYQIIEIYEKTDTLPDPYYTLESTDLERQQPYTSCEECAGIIQEEEEVVIQKYYARFKTCDTNGGSIIGISSTDPISTALVIKSGNQCFSYLDNLNSIVGSNDLSLYTDQYFSCQECFSSITGTTENIQAQEVLGYFRQYGDCETGGSDVTKDYGSTKDLGSDWPAVVIDEGLCMKDLGTQGTTSEVNVLNLGSFVNCDDCDKIANPTAPAVEQVEPTINKILISSTTAATVEDACSLITVFDIKVAYSGTLQDGVYIYTNDSLNNLYTSSSTNFVKSSNGHVFRIGNTNTGQVSELRICNAE